MALQNWRGSEDNVNKKLVWNGRTLEGMGEQWPDTERNGWAVAGHWKEWVSSGRTLEGMGEQWPDTGRNGRAVAGHCKEWVSSGRTLEGMGEQWPDTGRNGWAVAGHWKEWVSGGWHWKEWVSSGWTLEGMGERCIRSRGPQWDLVLEKWKKWYRCRYCYMITNGRRAPKGALKVWTTPHPPKKTEIFKNTDFVDAMISHVLRDLLFSRNQQVKSADNYYITILKNKIQNLGLLRWNLKKKKNVHRDLNLVSEPWNV